MEFSDDAILLSARPHGESAAIVTLMTREHGRHAGLLQGGASRRWAAHLQPGQAFTATWRARLSDHLGTWALEPEGAGTAARLMDQPEQLLALQSACQLVDAALPEREPHTAVYDGLAALLSLLEGEHWGPTLVMWEIALLREMGFGLELDVCAATGANDRLAYVSPRSGRAVSLSAGEPYRDRMLPLPGFLTGQGNGDAAEVRDGLVMTGHFIERVLLAATHTAPPPARVRLVERLNALCGQAGIGDTDDHE